MSTGPRLVIPGWPHHVTQRGNRKQKVFFCDDHRRLYIRLLAKYSKLFGVLIWAYCLMENHVHFVAVPLTKIALARAFGTTHRIYTKIINEREGWSGFLWQGRFFSEPLEDEHFAASMRYIELNPVRAKIVESAWDYPWSSAKAHVFGSKDPLLSDCFYVEEIKDWRLFLEE